MKKKSKIKNILIIVLAVILVAESVALVLTNKGKDEPVAEPESTEVVNPEPAPAPAPAPATTEEEAAGLLAKFIGDQKVSDMLRGIIYSNSIVSALMSAVYPMLYNELNNGGMLDFGPSIHLYPTGNQFAEQLGTVPYTAVDVDGARKPLTDVLNNVGSNWDYMTQKVKWTDEEGNEKETDIYNSIDWCVKDQDSFYKAMNDMTLGFRGLLEVSMQSKQGTVTINVLEFALHIDFLPINLDAAQITNDAEQTGYQSCLVYLFNLLGLVDGEYPTSDEFCNYGSMGEVWKALIETILFAVDKIVESPAQNVANVLVNLVNAIDTGTLVKRFRDMRMFGTYHPLAKMAMSMEDGEVFNLGNTLIGVIEDMGIKFTGNFNELLASVIQMLAGPEISVPKFNVAGLMACAGAKTLPNGNKIYKANPDKVLKFFVDYLMQGKILETILGMTGIFDKDGIAEIVDAFNKADDGISNLIEVVLGVVISSL